jgi:organic radical activating enzyme
MTFPKNLSVIKKWKEEVLDSKSESFCGAKWYHSSIWLWRGWTASCHHNPPHQIDTLEIAHTPSALHNTPKKINERAMMQRGEKPLDCQYCWVVQDLDSDLMPDRVVYSKGMPKKHLQSAFESPANTHVNPTYLELGFDSSCNLACSYCCPDISSSWMRDIKQNGVYQNIVTDERGHYTHAGSTGDNYVYGEENPYTNAFFKWWETDLHCTLRNIHITGGEPLMSGHFWKFLDWLEKNPNKSNASISIQTNLAYDSDTLNKFLNKISNVKSKISISTSVESIGSKAEYVRDGLVWDQWCKNIDTLIDNDRIRRVEIFSTISALSLNGFVEFLTWLVEKKKQVGKSYFDLYVSYVRWPTFQNVMVLPMEKRKQHSAELQDFIDNNRQWFSAVEQNFINRLISYLLEIQSPHRGSIISDGTLEFNDHSFDHDILAMQKDFKSFFSQYDQRRDKNFAVTFPNLAEWYESIQI